MIACASRNIDARHCLVNYPRAKPSRRFVPVYWATFPVIGPPFKETHLIIRLYESIAMRLHRVVRDLGSPVHTTVTVDATGCGRPFLDIIRKQKMGVLILPAGITSGGFGSYASGIERVPKKDLLPTPITS